MREKGSPTRGSQRLCQSLTGLPRERVAALVAQLAAPSGAVVTRCDEWRPCGSSRPKEARLVGAEGLAPRHVHDDLLAWWWPESYRGSTPNWDIGSTCRIGGKLGLLLVEAKAHHTELSLQGKAPTGERGSYNHEHIATVMQKANQGLEKLLPGWGLSRDHHYELSNRFAWAWKLASLKVPAVLIYLGFLNATEMGDQGQLFGSPEEWESCLRRHAQGVVPEDAWGRRWEVNGAPLWFLIRALDLSGSPEEH